MGWKRDPREQVPPAGMGRSERCAPGSAGRATGGERDEGDGGRLCGGGQGACAGWGQGRGSTVEGCAERTAAGGDGCGGGAGCAGAMPGIGGCRRRAGSERRGCGGAAGPPDRRVPRVPRKQQRCGCCGRGDRGTRRNLAGGGRGPGSRPGAGPHGAERAVLKGPVVHKAAAASPQLSNLSPSFHSIPPTFHPYPPPRVPFHPTPCRSPRPQLPFHPPAPHPSPSFPFPEFRERGAGCSWREAGDAVCRDSTKRLLCPCQGMRGAGAEHGPEVPSSRASLYPRVPCPSLRPPAGDESSWQCPSCRAAPRGFGELFPRPSHQLPFAPVPGLSIANLRCGVAEGFWCLK